MFSHRNSELTDSMLVADSVARKVEYLQEYTKISRDEAFGRVMNIMSIIECNKIRWEIVK